MGEKLLQSLADFALRLARIAGRGHNGEPRGTIRIHGNSNRSAAEISVVGLWPGRRPLTLSRARPDLRDQLADDSRKVLKSS